MKNFERYKTEEEREQAYAEYCRKYTEMGFCKSCPLKSTDTKPRFCTFHWLDLEAAEEEKPMPCPFCNNEYVEVVKGVAGTRKVECVCGYSSQAKESEADAIAAHNLVCKAVAAYNGSEVK